MGIKGLAKVSLLYTQKKSYIIKMVNTFQIASIAAIATTAFAYTSEKQGRQEIHWKNKAFISTGDIVSQLSLNCNNIALGGNILIEDQCKNTPACCEDVSGSTLSCSPLTLV
ncbi:hypothetical protein E3Q16_01398 [Wallemia mellicola]|uniref:Hydrophobin n=2 Tax=Wallemia mellicola TaxID=1708541 RepID=A0AB38N2W1_9BASI|nr:hypothetical protein E3Q24_01498 [Wallemia mellicola]TIB89832.1 hypothetical protein E3Q20_01535 [Wallemia mellicola]TIC06172.1 hypothetical protein E3Q16_01398 [Wallemia mellicola]TIC36105.1 hypothetical protein E3Q09_01676 [Wallemia mellicola]TIC50331.1 hypothetical protein E3Q06_01449 [Wallemia mellicola]